MSELAETIERVVREVLASLGYATANAAAPVVAPRADGTAVAVPSSAALAQPQPAARQEDGESLVLDRRVVTLADLPERIKTVQRVIVPRGTVVTPAVKDELQERKIKLIVGEASGAAKQAANVILAVAASTYDPAPLASALEREGVAVELRRIDCLIQATDQLAADLKPGTTIGILATPHTAAALCLANRHARVRAILGTRADIVAGEADSIGANLLVLDPTAIGFFAVKQMASRFLAGGPRQCPKLFQKRLG